MWQIHLYLINLQVTSVYCLVGTIIDKYNSRYIFIVIKVPLCIANRVCSFKNVKSAQSHRESVWTRGLNSVREYV